MTMKLLEGKKPRAVAAQLELLEETDVLELNVVLEYCEPKVERTIRVPAGSFFVELHDVLQTAMGWENAHLHNFKVGKAHVFMDPEDYFGEGDMFLDHETRLIDLLPGTNGKFSYTYDFGDSWVHLIAVKKVLQAAEVDTPVPYCTKGVGACPPEDCGGVWGYLDLLETQRSGSKERKEEMLEWYGGTVDPELFDLDEVNAELGTL